MEKVISISVGELALKGNNRKFFEDNLVKNIKRAISDIEYEKIYKDQGKIYIVGNPDDYQLIIKRVSKIFGIVYLSICYVTDTNLDNISETAIKFIEDYLPKDKSFKVQTKRSDKNYPMTSNEINMKIGGIVLEKFPELKVDVHNPDFYLYIDVKKMAYVYSERVNGFGGMPIGTAGKGISLLSGGIDSPVATFLMAKRGLKIDAVHFHSYPYTSERAEIKVHELAGIIARYIGGFKLFSVNLLEIQKAINENVDEKYMTILSRRFMMRIAERIAEKLDAQCIITGESLGQVASQTVEGLTTTNSVVKLPVFRPLIAHDKSEIVETAKEIETFEKSIEPYEDCCTVFLPSHPATRPSLKEVEKAEESLDVEKLIEDALNNIKVTVIE